MRLEESFTYKGGMTFEPVSNESYYRQEDFELERDKVFKRAWLIIGRVEEIPNPKDFVLKDIEMCSVQLIVSRAKDGSISCFHNVCPHRTNRVVLERSGSASGFVCNYHRWSFGLDGSLRGVPDLPAFIGFDKKNCGLKRVACEVLNGFIFINLEPEPVSLREYLGDFASRIEGMHLPFTNHPVVISAELNCNWKALHDGFSEGYHSPCVHAKTVADAVGSDDNPFHRPFSMRFSGPHHWSVIRGNPNYSIPVWNKLDSLLASLRGPADLSPTGNSFGGESANEVAKMVSHPSINEPRVNPWVNELNIVFPNLHFDTSPGGFWTHQFWPLAPDRTRWESRWYVARPKTALERLQVEQFVARIGEVMLEDVGNVERVQKGLESGAQPFMYLCDAESLIRHSNIHLDKWKKAETVQEALAA